MEGIQEFFSTIFNLLICISPILCILVLGAGGVGAYFFVQTKNKEKTEALLAAIADLETPGIDTVVSSRATSQFSSAVNLSRIADTFQQIIKGDANLVSKQVLNKIILDLNQYLQSASYGTLPDDDLNELRKEDSARINAFVQLVANFRQAVSEYNEQAARACLVDIDNTVVGLYDNHVAFRETLSKQEVEFPIPQPAYLAPTSGGMPVQNPEYVYADLLQRLPDEKQMLFMMQYDNVKKNPQVAVLLAVLLGGVGAHKFYMGQMGLGVLYLLFSWSWVPAIVGVIEAFMISKKVHEYNAQKATEIAYTLGLRND
jgi:TM2 domain-containing membrane protein YozV